MIDLTQIPNPTWELTALLALVCFAASVTATVIALKWKKEEKRYPL